MKKKYKITLFIIGLFLVLSLILGSSYAMWIFSVSQSGVNALNSDCFEVTFTDRNDINLTNVYPLSDEEGMNLIPYHFEVKNICNHIADFQANLEVLEGSTLDINYVTAGLNIDIDNYPYTRKLKDQQVNDASSYVNSNAIKSVELDHYHLLPNESWGYDLKLWVNEDSTKEQTANKILKSKVVVISALNKELENRQIMNGKDFNVLIKTLAGDVNPTHETVNTSITQIEESSNAPTSSDNYVIASNESLDTTLKVWYNDGTIFYYKDYSSIMYGKSANNNVNASFIGIANNNEYDINNMGNTPDKLYYNIDSSYMFANLKNLTSISLPDFEVNLIEDTSHMFDGCESLTYLDIRKIVMLQSIRLKKSSYMFANMINLETIISNNMNHLIESDNMFLGDIKLAGNKGTTYNPSYIDGTYAKIDEGSENPGYLTSYGVD